MNRIEIGEEKKEWIGKEEWNPAAGRGGKVKRKKE